MIHITIPYYENPGYLDRAIQSVLNQSSQDFKLLVVDDSPKEIPQSLIKKYQREGVAFSRNPASLGIGRNWNQCLNLAEGPYVTILHGDDELKPDYVSHVFSAFQSYPEAAAIFTRAETINEYNERIFSFPDWIKTFLMPSQKDLFVLEGEKGLSALLRGDFILCPTLCFNKGVLKEERFRTDLRYVLDLDFITRLLCLGKKLIGLPFTDYQYRRHRKSTSFLGVQNTLMLQEERDFYEHMAREFLKNGQTRRANIAKMRGLMRLKVLYSLFQKGGHRNLTKKLTLIFQ